MDTHRKIDIMGIINITNDSFYQGSRYLDDSGIPMAETVLEKAQEMISEGASIIDLGACSSRPGSDFPDMEEEWRRLYPVLESLSSRSEIFLKDKIRLSIDTFRSEIVRRAYNIIGPFIVNDISAGNADEKMLETTAELGLEYIAMHMRGNPETMQSMTDYADSPLPSLKPVTYAVLEYFKEFENRASRYGIKQWVIDPGFGFAKNLEQNYELLSELDKLKFNGHRLLVGVSRKSMIYKKFNISIEDTLPATQVLHLAALQKGADILRVHDVAEARRTVELYRILEG